jgi:hypothetical protein
MAILFPDRPLDDQVRKNTQGSDGDAQSQLPFASSDVPARPDLLESWQLSLRPSLAERCVNHLHRFRKKYSCHPWRARMLLASSHYITPLFRRPFLYCSHIAR